MKRIPIVLFVVFSVLAATLSGAQADTLVYPFDSITIVAATTFDVQVPAGLAPGSRFASRPAGSVLHVYMGEIVMNGIGEAGDSDSLVLVVTDAAGVDLHRFVVNSYSLQEGASKTWSFASHIRIDPEVGVVKDLSQADGFYEFRVVESLADGGWTFLDENGVAFGTVAGSLQRKTGLSVEISTNKKGGAGS